MNTAHHLAQVPDINADTNHHRNGPDMHKQNDAMYTASDVHPNASTIWAVTAVEHQQVRGYRGECEDCLRLADAAIANAAVTGSTGATFAEERVYGDKRTRHSCTVARATHIVVR